MARKFFCEKAKEIKQVFTNLEIKNYKIFFNGDYVSFYVDFGSMEEEAAKKRVDLEKAMLAITNSVTEFITIHYISLKRVNELKPEQQPIDFDTFLSEEFIRAVADKNFALVKILINEIDNVNFQENRQGQTALHVALAHLFILFCNFFKSPNERKSILDRLYTLEKIINLLLVHGIDVNRANRVGQTPLAVAIDMMPFSAEQPLYASTSEANAQAFEIISNVLHRLYKKGVAIDFQQIINKGYQLNESEITCGKMQKISEVKSAIFQPSKSKYNANESISSSRVVIAENITSAVQGELIESFNELILGELEMLDDITEPETKNLLTDILFDVGRSTDEVAKYAAEVDPAFGQRFSIVYCCMYPEKWNEPFMQAYKKSVIDSYIVRSTKNYDEADTTSHEMKANWLKQHANKLLQQFFQARDIQRVILDMDAARKKEYKLNNIKFSSVNSIERDIKCIEEEKTLVEEIIKEEGQPPFNIGADSLESSYLLRKDMDTSLLLPADCWKKLTLSEGHWQNIYELIKLTPNGMQRPQEKTLQIVRAILYKEATNCRWRELPQWLPRETTVRHYYYEWKKSGALQKIKNIMRIPSTSQRLAV